MNVLQEPVFAYAPAKINLCLFMGAKQTDGRHKLLTVFDSVSLADRVTIKQAASERSFDHVVCPGVDGQNLALQALELFREAFDWQVDPLEIQIEKHIPVAGGMAGGSADAAAVLRIAAALHGDIQQKDLLDLGAQLGSDVPSQVLGGPVMGLGGGEQVKRLTSFEEYCAVFVRSQHQLTAKAVYTQADQLHLGRSDSEISELQDTVTNAIIQQQFLQSRLLINDLQPAAIDLYPELATVCRQLARTGADHVLVSGSGPTVLGLFTMNNQLQRAENAVQYLRTVCSLEAELVRPVGSAFAVPQRL